MKWADAGKIPKINIFSKRKRSIEIPEPKKTQKYIPLSQYVCKTKVANDSDTSKGNIHATHVEKEIIITPKLGFEDNHIDLDQLDHDKMSFGQFMDSFEQQKDEIVKEWMQKNDVDFMEDTSHFNSKSKKRTIDSFESRKRYGCSHN